MLKKTYLLTLVVQLFTLYAFSQTKTVEIWYDPYKKTLISERYTVLTTNFDVKHGQYKSYSREGAITAEGNYNNGERTGKWIFRLSNNFTTSIENYNDKGERHGLFTAFDVINGQGKGLEGNYSNGKKDGSWKEWWCVRDHPNVLKYEGNYVQNERDGYWKFYYENGVMSKEGAYIKDHSTGEWKFYSENGTLIKKGPYVNGKESGQFSFYDLGGSGEKITEGMMSNGKRIGQWKIYFDKDWNETTDKKKIHYYRLANYNTEGIIEGKVTDYYLTGEKQFEGGVYAKDESKLDGDCIFYYKSGAIESNRSYAKGKGAGIWKGYYESGKKEYEIDFVGKKETYWYESGIVSKSLIGNYTSYYDEQGILIKVAGVDGGIMDISQIQKAEIIQLLLHIKEGIPNTTPFVLQYTGVVSFDDESQIFYTLENNYMSNPNFVFTKELKTASETYKEYSYARDQKEKLRLGKIVTDNLHKIVDNSLVIAEKTKVIEERRKKTTESFASDKQNKIIAEKAEDVFQYYNKMYVGADGSDKKIEVLNKMIVLYDRVDALKSLDNTELVKELKKAKSAEQVINLLKI